MNEAHIDKYEHNKKFAIDGIKDRNTYIDWSIIALFYSGMHLIEAGLAAIGQGTANTNDRHRARGDRAEKFLKNGEEIKKIHYNLYQASKKSRYDCIVIKDNDLTEAEQDLYELEKLMEIRKRKV